MANRSFEDVQAPESQVKLVSGGFTTNDVSAPDAPVGIVQSVARGGVGALTITMKEKYPSLLHHDLQVIGSLGTQMQLVSEDVANGSFVVQVYDTDGVAEDTNNEICTVLLVCRNDKLTHR